MNASQEKQDNKLIKGVVMLLLAVALVLISFFLTSERATTKTALSSIIVRYQLDNVRELVTQKFTYTDKAEYKSTRQLFSYDIPLTTKSVQLLYSGTVKAGYDLADVGIKVDNKTRLITIRLGEPVITDNYIDQDSIQTPENNNILNPIRTKEINAFLEQLRQEKEGAAIEAGLFTEAENNAKKVITDCLAVFSEYTVIFE